MGVWHVKGFALITPTRFENFWKQVKCTHSIHVFENLLFAIQCYVRRKMYIYTAYTISAILPSTYTKIYRNWWKFDEVLTKQKKTKNAQVFF